MERLFIKNSFQFKTNMQVGMVFRRVWFHKTGEEILDRKVVQVKTNGFWVEDLDCFEHNDDGLFCPWGTSRNWSFNNGKIYMLFNHEEDYKAKEKKLTPENFKRYKERYAEYVQNELPKGLIADGCKVLAIYELWSEEV